MCNGRSNGTNMELAYKFHVLTLLKELVVKLRPILLHRASGGYATESHQLFSINLDGNECKCDLHTFGDEITLAIYGLHSLLEDNVHEAVVYRFNLHIDEEVEEVKELLRELLQPDFDKYLTKEVEDEANALFFTRIGAMKEMMSPRHNFFKREKVIGFFFLDAHLRIEQVVIKYGRTKGRSFYNIFRTSLLGEQTKTSIPCTTPNN